jgi:SagB-type dehydrogenase family enzyme
LWKALQERRSIREYSSLPLSLKDLSNLLWAAQGITEKAFAPWYRTAPSAGALHPIDTYLIINRVEGMEPGIYFFDVVEFSLTLKRAGDFSGPIAQAALNQEIAQAAAVVFVWVAVIRRSRQKYRQRAYRYIYLDCGHIAQNLYLAATAMGLGCCGIAAIFDDEVNDLVGVDGQEETAIYLATVGKR